MHAEGNGPLFPLPAMLFQAAGEMVGKIQGQQLSG
jgi:hypothetical protein